MIIRWILLVGLFGLPVFANAQELTRYEQFEIKDGELIWQNTYRCFGSTDSIRAAVVQMLKSKYYTFNVIRNEFGYHGEMKHYRVNCKKFGKSYFNTPRIYCDGDWTGKFKLEINDHAYRIVVYGLYFETVKMGNDYLRTEHEVKGRYFDIVTNKTGLGFRKKELSHLSLMGFSLRDEFSLSSTKPVDD